MCFRNDNAIDRLIRRYNQLCLCRSRFVRMV